MTARFVRPWTLACVLALAAAGLVACSMRPRPLTVCAEPHNLPFSNVAGQGFENKIVALIAQDLRRPVVYAWWAQNGDHVSDSLKERRCDLWPGVASGVDAAATTRPYYRSTYVFVTRADRDLDIRSFDDPRLKRLIVGVQLVGDEGMDTPPAHALARRGVIDNVRGYFLYGNYAVPNRSADIIRAVDRGDIDVAVVWGPLAGYFAQRAQHRLRLEPVEPQSDGPQWPMAFDISMGVRKNDIAFRQRLNGLLAKDSARIDAILKAYGVPRPGAPAPDEANPSPAYAFMRMR